LLTFDSFDSFAGAHSAYACYDKRRQRVHGKFIGRWSRAQFREQGAQIEREPPKKSVNPPSIALLQSKCTALEIAVKKGILTAAEVLIVAGATFDVDDKARSVHSTLFVGVVSCT